MLKTLLAIFAASSLSLAAAAPLRLIVLVNDQDYEWGNRSLSSASMGMTQLFLKNGFVVLDAAQLETVKDRDLILNALDGDVKAAIALATSFSADAIVIGNATAERSVGVNLGPFNVQGYSGVANVRAIVASTGQVLAAVSGRSNKAGLSGSEGEREALFGAGENAGSQLIAQLKTLSGQKTGAGLTRITIKGLGGFTDALAIVKELQAQKGVVSVERRSFSNGVLELDFTAEFGADEVAALLENLTLTKLSVTSVNNNSIDAAMK